VIGALAGVIGSMAALEAIKHITGAGEPLTGRLLLYDGLSATSRTVEVTTDPGCPVCSTSALIQSPARGVPKD
jgi:molybdopterin/thiamine biosynthesis adenylyltransferase